MKTWMNRGEDASYALLRMVSGAMFAFHGMQKIFGLLSSHPSPPVGSQLWFGGLVELVAGLLILAGFHARPAAFIASGQMAVAYIQFHWKLQLGAAFFPAINQGELAVLYCFVFLFISAHGDGIWSLGGRKAG